MTRLIDKEIIGYKNLKQALREGYAFVSEYKNKINGTLEIKYYIARLEG